MGIRFPTAGNRIPNRSGTRLPAVGYRMPAGSNVPEGVASQLSRSLTGCSGRIPQAPRLQK
ncbi:hypothetical protein HMPREF9141_0335 [Prevotella multiformis DSM 16608]|uniref:Uncharacterized protein n=1 Tax=Prevotella multiformis DSM 16608 TaxID=888743 RepID=F0F419_9BACT|nr:hypothetical protein HMPREF9141_0335 [Prevotella multiformis DSM 16608]